MFKIYSKIYNCFANELLLVLKEIYSDYQKYYDSLANYRMKHYKNKFANNHIKGIKNFCRYAISVDQLNLMDKGYDFTKNTKYKIVVANINRI